MYRIFSADKDTYISDRVVQDVRHEEANVGVAGSLDLFKLYGNSTTGSLPNIELSRLLIHFDLTELRSLITTEKINVNDPSFSCHLKLFDVYGGQPTPRNFRVTVHPLSRSFDEGLGRDVVTYDDNDVANFLTSSHDVGPWLLSGANFGGHATSDVDYITSVVINGSTSSVETTQLFSTGLEDLYVDVTTIVSSTLAGALPDCGMRIALTSSLETNDRSYFVKRFASRTAYNEDKHPQLIVKFDDSLHDDSSNLYVDTSGSIVLRNFSRGNATNLTSGSNAVTGSNSLKLKLMTEVSGGYLTLNFPASQASIGGIAQTGMYVSDVFVEYTAQLQEKMRLSGSLRFTPVWGSNDDTVAFLTASIINFYPPTRGTTTPGLQMTVNVQGLQPDISRSEQIVARVNIFDANSPVLFKVKVPIQVPSLAIRDVFYAIRDTSTDVIRIPFDKEQKSTKLSSDGMGMFFSLDASNLVSGRTYVVDILVSTNGIDKVYRSASAPFRVMD